jgi:glutathione S-transferase
MIVLYFAPRTRAIRVGWLLEELGLPHVLRRVTFKQPKTALAQDTPLGKLPVSMSFTLAVARLFAVLDETLPNLQAYLARLEARPAFKASAEM